MFHRGVEGGSRGQADVGHEVGDGADNNDQRRPCDDLGEQSEDEVVDTAGEGDVVEQWAREHDGAAGNTWPVVCRRHGQRGSRTDCVWNNGSALCRETSWSMSKTAAVT